ncbi:hypothetical protein D8674_026182 [Pyrus ussuriensis x Pyrus communis]|uniref:Uncharacterized protein n=1 Tax=Pyrus ussuriensis x Pyrus communis TaxID=2448454 RepID=A0A5N5I784_9ROSA|nr:hypothetical protein D8674_026182 [Pyrus ussuriensis x Pyrus communis]
MVDFDPMPRKEKKKKRKAVVQMEIHNRHKQIPSYEDKSGFDSHTELRLDIGRWCEPIVLSSGTYWDVDETDQKQVKYLDDHFKNGYRVWKFDVERAAELEQVPDAPKE